jgi:hypothetical protein
MFDSFWKYYYHRTKFEAAEITKVMYNIESL